VINFASSVKGGTLRAAFDEAMKKAEGHCSANYRFHMEIVDFNDQIGAEILEMPSLGVTSFKVYMAYDIRIDDAAIYNCLKAVKQVNGLLGAHCENGDLLKAKAAELIANGELSPAAHPKSHPVEVEAEAISRLAYIGKLAGHRPRRPPQQRGRSRRAAQSPVHGDCHHRRDLSAVPGPR
jgi:dihydropyrimidinase